MHFGLEVDTPADLHAAHLFQAQHNAWVLDPLLKRRYPAELSELWPGSEALVLARAADDVAQLYLREEVTSVATPLIALRGFQRVHLAPGEQAALTFTLAARELSLLDAKLRRVVEPGTFRVMIGRSA